MRPLLHWRPVLLVLGLAFASGSCSNSSFPSASQLGPTMILSLQLSPPEVNPGATVTLTPLVSDLNGGGRALTYTIEACPDPGIAQGATPTCDTSPNLVTVASNQPLTGLTSPTYTGTGPTASITVPSNTLDNQPSYAQYDGVN